MGKDTQQHGLLNSVAIYSTMILLLLKHAKTCPCKGIKPFLEIFQLLTMYGYSKKILLLNFFYLKLSLKVNIKKMPSRPHSTNFFNGSPTKCPKGLS